MFLPMCFRVVQELSRRDGSHHSLHASAKYHEYNKDLISPLMHCCAVSLVLCENTIDFELKAKNNECLICISAICSGAHSCGVGGECVSPNQCRCYSGYNGSSSGCRECKFYCFDFTAHFVNCSLYSLAYYLSSYHGIAIKSL